MMAMGRMMKSDEFKQRADASRPAVCSKNTIHEALLQITHMLDKTDSKTHTHTQLCSLVQPASIAHALKVLCEATGQLSMCKAN